MNRHPFSSVLFVASIGDSDLTWQTLVDFNYEFSKFDVGIGYRILEWQADGEGLIDDFGFSGPYVGMAFNFK